ncbi:hypothetical protein PoB_006564500 [Plakobranchus ocellatus]|uniref:Uncharacterized protein n=1 Tax=Plakobranchus ocellatus TaxID=259542 RepID=A0AAV4D4Y1_9GAST|nr:hypothetical protein PoB_006564500 [Plakobranchus ocellatus]
MLERMRSTKSPPVRASVTAIINIAAEQITTVVEATTTTTATGTECEVGNRVISHGELFTDPSLSHCLVHQCYFGSSFLYSEGCEDSMAGCHGVGEQWEENCLTYTCTRTAIRGYNYYQPILQTARCRDADGSCHDQGQIFTYVLRGRRHNYCSCIIRNNRILYRCF